MDFRRYIPIACLVIGVVALQAILSAAQATFYMTQLTMAVYYSLVAVGLCLLMGYAGQVSLGHAGFFAIGGYCSASLTTWNLLPHAEAPAVRLLRGLGLLLERRDLYGHDILHISPWLAFAAAMLLAACTALVIGVPVIRLKGHYLAMATLGFGVIVYRMVLGTPWLGEADGFSDVPPFRVLGGLEINGRAAFRVSNYYVAWAVMAAVMVLGINLVHSRVGRALRSIHEGEEAAHSLGIDVARYKLSVFVISAILAALAGVLMTHYTGGIGPSEATALKSIRYVSIVAVGGMANLWGALAMGTVLNFLSLRGVFGSYDDAVFGLILITIMLFAPRGIVRWPGLRFLLSRKPNEKPSP
jgi:branched-chain amino acid transport system permease protein